jgi:hypothetical protein
MVRSVTICGGMKKKSEKKDRERRRILNSKLGRLSPGARLAPTMRARRLSHNIMLPLEKYEESLKIYYFPVVDFMNKFR